MKAEVDIIIARSHVDVFNYLIDFEKNSTWQSGVQSATITLPGPIKVGSTYTQISRFLGKPIEFAFEVVEFEAEKRVRFKTTSGTFPVDIVRAVEAIPEGTRVIAIIEGDSSGIFRLMEPIVRTMMRRQIRNDYQALKQLLENQ